MEMLRKKIGSFYLVDKIGSGGMSEVYLAIDPRTRQKQAFKIMQKRVTRFPSDYTRFLREVEIIRGLSHPGIIKVFDNGALENCYYYSMEFIAGGSLAQSLGRKKIEFPTVAKLFLHISTAMAYAHDKGIIHRDLKPSNVLLKSWENPVISDFGIAKTIAIEKSALTQSGKILGTIAYLAPEQRFDTKRVDQRADVYALGAMFYEMLMGFPPLGKFPWPGEVLPGFPESLQSILEKCLSVEPEKRFKHAGFLLYELEKCKEFEDIDHGDVVDFRKKSNDSDDTVVIGTDGEDRIEMWLHTMRTGTTRERLATVHAMVDTIKVSEVNSILKLYPGENDRVRWGLIRVLGDLKIPSATQLILNDIKSPFHAECAIEALGKIGSDEAFNDILEYVNAHSESALIALLPLAQTGKDRAIPHICRYLDHEMSVMRQASVRALSAIKSMAALQVLKDQLNVEHDEKVRSLLLQTVYSMESELLPHLNVPVQRPVVLERGERG